MKAVFSFLHALDGTTTVRTTASKDTFTYTTASGPASADAWILAQVKDHLIEYETQTPPEPSDTEPPAPGPEAIPTFPIDVLGEDATEEAVTEDDQGETKPARRDGKRKGGKK